jgi:hypothetical protein
MKALALVLLSLLAACGAEKPKSEFEIAREFWDTEEKRRVQNDVERGVPRAEAEYRARAAMPTEADINRRIAARRQKRQEVEAFQQAGTR